MSHGRRRRGDLREEERHEADDEQGLHAALDALGRLGDGAAPEVDPSLPPATEAALQSENARLRERLAAAAEASLAANAAAPAAPVYNFL